MKSLANLKKRPLALCLGALLIGLPPTVGHTAGTVPIAPMQRAGIAPRREAASSQPLLARLKGMPDAPAGQIAVTNCDDSGPGSLRAAVLGSQEGNSLDLQSLPCSLITLTSGELHVGVSRLNVIGPGAARLTIDAGATSRVLAFDGGTYGAISLSGLTLRNGTANGNGGCLYSTATLKVSDSVIAGCRAYSAVGETVGGAIATGGLLYLTRSQVTDSAAVSDTDYAKGGGVYARGMLVAQASTIARNAAASNGARSFGGGAYLRNGGSINDSTISANQSTNAAGLSLVGASGSATLTNSTVSGNRATGFIGGVYSSAGLVVSNSTIAFNCAAATEVFPGYDAGVGLQAYLRAPQLQSSIVSNNSICETAASPVAPTDVAFDVGFYGVESITGANNLILMASVPVPADTLEVDPELLPLADNGGATLTHALVPGSPAIDVGNNVAALAFDQRLHWSSRVVGDGADIGAYELQSEGSVRQADNCADAGAGSLRDLATLSRSGDSIDLRQLGCSRITLTTGAIDLPQGNIRLLGPGAGALTLDGGQHDRILHHTGAGTLTLEGLALEHGYVQAVLATGGCIDSASRVIANDSTFRHCDARATADLCRGGAINAVAIYLQHSIVSSSSCASFTDSAYGGGAYASELIDVQASTISDNVVNGAAGESYFGFGAGLLTAGSAYLAASTVSGNQGDVFSGVYAVTARIVDSTVSGNVAFVLGAGVGAGRASVLNSTVAFNTTLFDTRPYAAGLFVATEVTLQSSVIFGNTLGGTSYDAGGPGIFSGANNLVGFAPIILPVGTLRADPLLGPLQDNGGPTLTHELGADSPAIDTGNNVAALANDQRGGGFARSVGAATDIGAFERQNATDVVFADGFDAL